MAWAEPAVPTVPHWLPQLALPQFPTPCSTDEPGPLAVLGLPGPTTANGGTWINPIPRLPCSLVPGGTALPVLQHSLAAPHAAGCRGLWQPATCVGRGWEPGALPVPLPCPVTPGPGNHEASQTPGFPGACCAGGVGFASSTASASSTRGAVCLLGLLACPKVCLWSHITQKAAPDGVFV